MINEYFQPIDTVSTMSNTVCNYRRPNSIGWKIFKIEVFENVYILRLF